MARKSSKTAHVMNLLAGSEADASKTEAANENISARQTSDTTNTIKELTVLAQQASIQTQDSPLSPSPISIINMSSSVPDPVAERIKQQLEEEEKTEWDQTLSSEEGTLQAEPEQNNFPQTESSQTEPMQMRTSQIKSEQDTDSQTETLQTPPLQSNSTQGEPQSFTSQPAYQYLNIMEHVVNSKVEEYMQKFEVCTCGRCIADVKALALTHLPSKYIVVEAPAVSPLLNFYSNRFSQQVIVELTKACSIVKENPHH